MFFCPFPGCSHKQLHTKMDYVQHQLSAAHKREVDKMVISATIGLGMGAGAFRSTHMPVLFTC